MIILLSLLLGRWAATPGLLLAQREICPAAAYSNLSANPITGDLRGTEITITSAPTGCLVLVRIAEGGPETQRSAAALLVGDSLTFRLPPDSGLGAAGTRVQLSEAASFAGAIVRDTLWGRFDRSAGTLVVLPRMQGPVPHSHVHDAGHEHR